MSVSISAVHRCLYGPGELLLSSGFMLKLKRTPVLKLVPKVDEEFAGLIAPLSSEERQQLEDNLIAHGCRDALVIKEHFGQQPVCDGVDWWGYWQPHELSLYRHSRPYEYPVERRHHRSSRRRGLSHRQ
jgi:hypothetical protein